MTVRRKPRLALAVAPILVVVGLWLPATVHAQHYASFQAARDAYERGEYGRVVEVLEPLIGGEVPEIRDEVLLRESRKYLGAAYVITGQRELGAAQFEALLRAEGDAFDDYRLDPAAFPSRVHEVFDEVRDRLIQQRREDLSELQRRQEEEEQRRHAALLELVELAQEDEVGIEHDPLLAWVPFGAGQFQNGNEGLGWFFAASEGIAFGLAAASMAVWLPLDTIGRSPGIDTPRTPQEDGWIYGMQATNLVSAGLFAALAIAGVIEAHVNFVPSHRVRRRRQVPDRILEDLDLAIGPTRVSLRLRF